MVVRQVRRLLPLAKLKNRWWYGTTGKEAVTPRQAQEQMVVRQVRKL
jgi:hypothetical protein